MKKLFLLTLGLLLPLSVIAFTWDYILTWEKLNSFYTSSQYLFGWWAKVSNEVTLYEWHMVINSLTGQYVVEVVKQKDPEPLVKDSKYWKERIQYWCEVHWIKKSTCDTAKRIAYAESRYNPYAKYWYWSNPKKVNERICVKLPKWSCSSAAWMFQFINWTRDSASKKYWFAWSSKYNWDVNIQVALLKMKNEWFSAWNASSHAW